MSKEKVRMEGYLGQTGTPEPQPTRLRTQPGRVEAPKSDDASSQYLALAREWLEKDGGSVYNVLEYGGGFDVEATNHSPPQTDHEKVISSLASLLERVAAGAAEQERRKISESTAGGSR